MAFLVLERGMPHEAVLDLTPAQIWYYFEKAQQVRARGRLEEIADLTAVSAPTAFKDGIKYHGDHIKALKAAAAVEPTYTTEQLTD